MEDSRARTATADVVKAPGEGGIDPMLTDPGPLPERYRSEALDSILGRTFPVLDQGFVRVVDYMGCDASIVQAARVSYGAGTKSVSDDRALIRYLLRHAHTSPFEMCSIKLHVKVPMDTWRQWIRHRTASVNEYSTRYSEAIDATQKTDPKAWRKQATANKQGSAGFVTEYPASGEMFAETLMPPGEFLSAREEELQILARAVYEERLKFGVAREQARKDLPLSTYTEAYWSIDLHNLLHFLALRMDSHAQEEIRRYAETIATICQAWVPETWQAFRDYRLDAVRFSGPEMRALRRVFVSHGGSHLRPDAPIRDWCEGMGQREIDEFLKKLKAAGLIQ